MARQFQSGHSLRSTIIVQLTQDFPPCFQVLKMCDTSCRIIITDTGIIQNFHHRNGRIKPDSAYSLIIESISIDAKFLSRQLLLDSMGNFIGICHNSGCHDSGTIRTQSVIKRDAICTFAKITAVIRGKT